MKKFDPNNISLEENAYIILTHLIYFMKKVTN